MERDDIFRAIQAAVEDTPLLMIGSGSSAPYGLPGMQELGEHLLKQLDIQAGHFYDKKVIGF